MDSQQVHFFQREGLPVGHGIHAGAGEKGWIVNRCISLKREGLPVGHGIYTGTGEGMDSQRYLYSNKEGIPVGQKKKWIVNTFLQKEMACP